MKRIFLTTVLVSVFLLGCRDTKYKNENSKTMDAAEAVHKHDTSTTSNQEEVATKTLAINNVWVNEIKLDNGQKWQANSETTEGVDKMLSLIKSNDPKTVEDYHNLASKLNEEKNFVIKECTMKGPSHDNLHVFLHPLIDKIGVLEKVSTPDKGAEILVSIKENLEGYYNYFQ